MKVVINACFGGFGLSNPAMIEYAKRKYDIDLYFYKRIYGENDSKTYVKIDPEVSKNGWYDMSTKDLGETFEGDFTDYFYYESFYEDESRACPILVDIVERMGKEASGSCANLVIVEIPDDVEYVIEEYDGNEHIAEKHRTWR